MRLQRYNYNTGAIEPIDLTGSQLRMAIRPPPRYDVDVSLTHNATGVEYKTTITLSEEEKSYCQIWCMAS